MWRCVVERTVTVLELSWIQYDFYIGRTGVFIPKGRHRQSPRTRQSPIGKLTIRVRPPLFQADFIVIFFIFFFLTVAAAVTTIARNNRFCFVIILLILFYTIVGSNPILTNLGLNTRPMSVCLSYVLGINYTFCVRINIFKIFFSFGYGSQLFTSI